MTGYLRAASPIPPLPLSPPPHFVLLSSRFQNQALLHILKDGSLWASCFFRLMDLLLQKGMLQNYQHIHPHRPTNGHNFYEITNLSYTYCYSDIFLNFIQEYVSITDSVASILYSYLQLPLFILTLYMEIECNTLVFICVHVSLRMVVYLWNM